jgi:type IX secretion system PorP/SprF family membrane protein
MIIRKLSYFSFLFLFGFFNQMSSQSDPAFSQFYASSIYLNPAIAGMEHRFAITGIHRTQQVLSGGENNLSPSTGATYSTQSLSVIIPWHGSKDEEAPQRGGFGLNVYRAGAGQSMNTLGFSFGGAYNIKFGKAVPQNFTFGLQGGILQRTYDVASFRLGSNYDGAGGFDAATSPDALLAAGIKPKIMPDIMAGILYYYNAGRNVYAPGMGFYIGLVAGHLNAPNQSPFEGKTDRVATTFKIHSGMEIHIAKKINMSPNLFWIKSGSNSAFTLGTSFTYLIPDHDAYFKPTRLVFGYSYRFGDAMIFQIGFGSKYYAVGISYDFYTTEFRKNLSGFAGNAFEISFKTTLHISKKAKKSSKFHTPLM